MENNSHDRTQSYILARQQNPAWQLLADAGLRWFWGVYRRYSRTAKTASIMTMLSKP